MSLQKFEPGEVVATPGCLAALEVTGQTPHEFLARHVSGDWGDVNTEDAASNDDALVDDSRILSAFVLTSRVHVWVITEAAGDDGRRASTCLLLPDEY